MMKKLKNNVCKLICDDGDNQGTGFLIDKAFILTAYHVVEDKTRIIATFTDEVERIASIHKKDEKLDIAILKIEEVDFYEAIKLDSSPLSRNQQWKTFGYPIVKFETGEPMEDETENKIHQILDNLNDDGYNIELNFNKKLSSYEGLSGSPFVVGDKIVGIIKTELINGGEAKELHALSFDYLEGFLGEFCILNTSIKKNRIEVKIEAKEILKLAVAPRDFKNLSKNKGEEIPLKKIHYEYYSYQDGDIQKGYLFLGNLIINKNVFENFKNKIKDNKLNKLEIFLVKEKNDISIIKKKNDIRKNIFNNQLEYLLITKTDSELKDIKLKRKMILEKTEDSLTYMKDVKLYEEEIEMKIHYIDDFIWDNTFGMDDEIDSIYKRDDFIDQYVYDENGESKKLCLEFFQDEIKNPKIPISLIYGDGGVGKTTFCDALEATINQSKEIRKKVFHIKGERIVDILTESKELLSLNDLYLLYKDEVNFDVERENFNLNYISGNLIVIIDAIEEIESKMGDNFNIKSFFNSLQELNTRFYNTKIIITTRELFFNKVKKMENFNKDIQYFRFLGFTKDNLDSFLNKKYKDKKNSKRLVENFIEENKLFNEDNIIPLFVDLVCDIVDRDESSENIIKSKYFCSTQIDDLLKFLLSREKTKQSLKIELDDIFEILESIVLDFNNSITEDELKNLIDAFEEYEITKYVNNPLFIKRDNIIKIKYEVLVDFIKSRSLRRKLLDSKVSDSLISLLVECFNGERSLFNEMLNILNKEITIENYKTIVKDLKSKLENENNNTKLENIKKSLSAILYFSCYLLVDKKDNQEYMEVIENIYGGKNIQNLYIFGDFFPLNFKEVTITNSKFHDYKNFEKSIFPEICKENNVIFCNTVFKNIHIQNKNKITKDFFDSDCDYYHSNIEKMSEETSNKIDTKLNDIKDDIIVLAKYISATRSENLIKLNCENKINYRKSIKKLLEWLVNIKFLKETNGLYKIDDDYRDKIHKIITMQLFPIELEEEIEKFID